MIFQAVAIKHVPWLHVQAGTAGKNATDTVTKVKVIGQNGHDSAIEKHVMIGTEDNDIAYDVRPTMRRPERLKMMRF
jgi:hypothetical protein